MLDLYDLLQIVVYGIPVSFVGLLVAYLGLSMWFDNDDIVWEDHATRRGKLRVVARITYERTRWGEATRAFLKASVVMVTALIVLTVFGVGLLTVLQNTF